MNFTNIIQPDRDVLRNLICRNSITNMTYNIKCSFDDTTVNIKRRISLIVDQEPQKIDLFIDNSTQLNDNEFIPLDINNIFFSVNKNDADKILVQVMRNYFNIPKWILINRQGTIKQLKDILSSYTQLNLETFIFNETGQLLLDNETIESCYLINFSKLKVWRGKNQIIQLKICNPLTMESFPLEVLVTEFISDLKNKISEKICQGKLLTLALFTEISYLQDGTCLLDYPISYENCEVFYTDLMKKENIKIVKKIKNGKYSKIFDGLFGDYSERVAVNRYKFIEGDQKISKILKYEIVTRLMLNKSTNGRFIQLMSMYQDSNYFFVVTDFMEQGSLKDIYLKNPINDQKIIHYSIQISEALDFMHTKKFIHRNLSCSSVLIDPNNNIKLSNFHLSKYLFNCTTEQLMEGVPGSRIDDQKCWLAPEVLRSEPYGIKSDIWSFGVTVMEMLTRNRPYPDDSILLASYKIHKNKAIEYDKNISTKLSYFIDLCLHSSQGERPTAKQCKQVLESIDLS